MSYDGDAKVINYKGVEIKIKYDEDGPNPRKEWDNVASFWFWHRRYNMGDKDTPRYCPDNYKMLLEMIGEPVAYITPVMMYDHGGTTIWAGNRYPACDTAGWDSGQIGWAFVTMSKARKEMPNTSTRKLKKWAEEITLAEIKCYDDYMTGQVYGYVIEDEDLGIDDSCWGFVGDIQYCIDEAMGIVDYYVKKLSIKAWDKLTLDEKAMAV